MVLSLIVGLALLVRHMGADTVAAMGTAEPSGIGTSSVLAQPAPPPPPPAGKTTSTKNNAGYWTGYWTWRWTGTKWEAQWTWVWKTSSGSFHAT
jgi:hypothetical protein